MCKGQKLRALVNERLTAAAAEIFELFERTIAEYEQEVLLLKQRNHKQLQQLERAGIQTVARTQKEVGTSLETPHIKEEPELCIKQEPEEFPFHMVSVKTEDDEDKSSVLHQRPTEENREETNGEDCGAEAGCSSDLTAQRVSLGVKTFTYQRTPNQHTFSCSVCSKGFAQKYRLSVHMRLHTGERPYSCPVCSKGYTYKSNLKEHMKKHSQKQSPIKPHRCSECGKSFLTRVELQSHTLDHSAPFRCSVCEKGFKLKGTLKRHTMIHTGEKPYICPVCTRAFRHSNSLKGHLENHKRERDPSAAQMEAAQSGEDGGAESEPEEEEECPIVSVKELSTDIQTVWWSQEEVGPGLEPPHIKEEPALCINQEKEQLQEFPLTPVCVETEEEEDKSSVPHQRPDPKVHRCSDCGKRFVRNSELQSHELVHTGQRPFRCSVCGKCFRRKSHVKRHTRVHSGEKPYVCIVCGKAFAKTLTLKKHTRIHSEEGSTQTRPDSVSDSKPHLCSECGKGFQSTYDLQKHELIHTGEKPFECPFCAKFFTWKCNLKTHLRIHTGEKPYSCSVCQKSFTEQNALSSHMTVHTGERPFSCLVCGKGFARKGNLKGHMRTHTGDKPYKCQVCAKDFSLKHSLKVHMRIHTGEKPFSCTVCQRPFSLFGSLIRHQKTHSKDSTESKMKTPVTQLN